MNILSRLENMHRDRILHSCNWPAPILSTTSKISLWIAICRCPLYSTLFYHTRLSYSIWNRTLRASFTQPIKERITCFSFTAVIRRQIRRTLVLERPPCNKRFMLHESISISETDGVIQNDLTSTIERYENTSRIIYVTGLLLKIFPPWS